ncbi:5-formyltetrahydrofolate cyclo-ligase [Neisseria sp. ZJ106]|uniref:5-formyltetrahydrofolate cyclo-ligase n=1 Tax=Neisseria lisongii TaxID=2912188 RepID=A0AAW5ASH2_9NEIS|nr:5-formyltetrahydrofolate cyclo-ligase [Neisseria lisongii]MCF7520986.1 5-formyltetrahydrofolate cyclo-ligase [Neisseria lisongii]MCF7529930.1 5-formyltetrahydrofolate cyclo-ligase [Neisseria lisongii]WCL71212.1 5-formyltetrahydrofolate cyclo-ligase [Neisseria lisongii]
MSETNFCAATTRNTEKTELRRRLRKARAAMSEAERAAATRTINVRLKRLIRRNSRIGIYWPIGKELRLDGFVQAALQRGAKLYLPYIEPNARRLWFTPYFADQRQRPERRKGRSKLYIPQFAGEKIRVHRLNTLIVPVVGMDRRGFRLGQAGGFYDATLSAMKHRLQAKTIGAGFACQLVDALPAEAHDIPLDGFVSEHDNLRF